MYISLIEEHFGTTIDRGHVLSDDASTTEESYDWWNAQFVSTWDHPMVEMEFRTTAGLLIPDRATSSQYKRPMEARERLLRRRSVIKPVATMTEEYPGR
jgi:xylulokinase